MSDKIAFKQTEIVIDGKKFTIQKIPFKAYLDLEDRCTNRNGVLMKTPYITELFKHCVVSPKITLSDFDDDFNLALELSNEIDRFLKSKSEQKPNTKEGKE